MKKWILFDVWRTLVYLPRESDPEEKIIKVFGLNSSYDEVSKIICVNYSGNPKNDSAVMLKRLGISTTPSNLNKLQKIIDEEQKVMRLYADVRSVLCKLRKNGYCVGIFSETWPFPTHKIEDFLDGCKDFSAYSCYVNMMKADGRLLNYCLEKFHVPKKEVLAIGDNMTSDIGSANRIGVPSVLLDRKNQNAKYNPRITNLHQLPSYLQSL
jgi:FMN phosphatase YigB (HAD superfamily)